MKKVICFVVCLLFMAIICSCQKEPVPVDTGTSGQPAQGEIAETSGQNKEENEPVTEPPTTHAPEEILPSQPETTPEDEPPEVTVTEPPATTPQPITEVTLQLSQGSYTVPDPENTKGLSTELKGFSYGVAKNGVPHDQSIINQRSFDGYEDVKALALDTKTQEKIMYLTFDNGYEYEKLTADILDTLKEKDVKAAFFVTLSYAKQNPQLVQRMIDEGHIVGNHSSTHPSFPKITRTQMAEEIATLDNYLRENFGYSSPYFRFPSGEHSECALELVTAIGFKSVFWSAAYADWDTSTQKGAEYAFSTVTSRFHPGAVILLHAVSRDNAEALGSIIDEARNQGYTFRTLDEYDFGK